MRTNQLSKLTLKSQLVILQKLFKPNQKLRSTKISLNQLRLLLQQPLVTKSLQSLRNHYGTPNNLKLDNGSLKLHILP